jgi:hypothetical protein
MLLICFSLRSCVVLFVVDQSFHVKMIIGFSILLTLFWKQISILLVAMSTLNYVVFICSNQLLSDSLLFSLGALSCSKHGLEIVGSCLSFPFVDLLSTCI